MFMVGELSYDGVGCEIESEPMEFVGDMGLDEKYYSQLVISESAASCIADSVTRSPIGKLELDETRMNQLFERNDIKLDSTSIAEHIPIFQDKYGKKKPLKI